VFETVGQKLGKHLGIKQDVNAVIQRAINVSVPVYRIIIDSRYPYRTILYSMLKKTDTLKAGRYSDTTDEWKNLRYAPPKDLWTFDENILDRAIITFNDLSAELYRGQKAYEAKEGNGRLRLREFTIGDFKNNISDITKYWSKERAKVAGQDTRLTKLIEFREPGTFVFLTEPTYEPRVTIYPKGIEKGTDNAYTLMIQIVDFDEWFPDPLKVTYKEFQEVLKVADVKLDSDDASYQFQGFRKQLQDLDSAIYPTNAPDKGIWSKRHDGALLSKHLYWLLHYINFHMPAMYRKMKDYYLQKYGAIEPKSYKPGKVKIKQRSADDIVLRK